MAVFVRIIFTDCATYLSMFFQHPKNLISLSEKFQFEIPTRFDFRLDDPDLDLSNQPGLGMGGPRLEEERAL